MTRLTLALASLVAVLAAGCGGGAGDASSSSPRVAVDATDAAPAATALDGTYRWTMTVEDVLRGGPSSDQTPERLATFPALCTMALVDGSWTLDVRHANTAPETHTGTYTIAADQLAVSWPAEAWALTFAFSVEEDGSLTMRAVSQMEAPIAFFWTTHPWRKIG